MKKLLLLLVLLLSTSLSAQTILDHLTLAKSEIEAAIALQAPPGPVYTALSDRSVRPKPAPPVVGPAGFTFVDPTFGSKMWRVTDPQTSNGSSLRVPSSAHLAAWNANGSIFYVMTEGGGTVFFAFDPQVGPTKLPVTFSAPFSQLEPSFSYVDLATIYGVVQHKVQKWNVITGAMTPVLDLDTLGLSLGADTYVGGILTEDNDVWVTFFGGTGQDRHYYVRHSVAGLLDVRTKGSWKIHAISMDRTGRYVFIYPAVDPNTGQLPTGVAQVQLWDTQTGSLTPLTALPAGHDSAGYGVWINADCCSGGSWDASQWQYRSLAALNSPSNLIPAVLTPQEVYLSEHSNWRAARPDVKVPFVSASYRYGAGLNLTTYPWRAWDEEIIAVSTDGSGKVWRFAHTQSVVGVVPDFWAEPIVNCAPDGRHCLFTSNWGVAGGRQDVFLVELR